MCSCNKVLIVFALLGVLLIILGAVLGFAVFKNIVADQIAEKVELKKGTEQYDRWTELPFPLTFKVYFFNVENPYDVTYLRKKPIVKEVGPYVYKQYRIKQDITYYGGNDTLNYTQKQIYEFDAKASVGLETDKITLLNVPLQGSFQTAEAKGTGSLGTANNGWKTAFDTDSLFHTVSVSEYLFDGHKICVSKNLDIFGRLFCVGIQGQVADIKTLRKDDEGNILFSFFHHKNDSHDGAYDIKAGIDDVNEVGEIVRWQNEPYLSMWKENTTCNKIRGKDSSIYAPYVEDGDSFDIFNSDICRIVTLEHSGEQEFKGVKGFQAKLGRDSLSNIKNDACYCIKQTRDMDGELECLPEGFGDMNPCVGAPVVISYPHLLWADCGYQSSVVGLSPNESKHVTYVNVEPGTGSPLNGAKRIQFNMFIRPIEKIVITENIRPAVLPILWVEEGFEITDELIDQLKSDYLDKLVILDAVTWVLIGLGIALFVGCAGYYLIKKR